MQIMGLSGSILGAIQRQRAFVKASNTEPGDRFGRSVALSLNGTTLAVGAPNEDSSTTGINSTPYEDAIDAGAVYLY